MLCGAWLLLAGSGMGSAQPAEPRSVPPAGELADPGEVNRLFDAYAIMQAQETLHLDEAKFGSFVTRLKGLQEARRRNMRARAQIIQDLQRLLRQPEGTVDDATLKERLDALAKQDTLGATDIKRAADAVDELLDTRQRARFRVFEHQLELKKLELLARVRQQMRGNRPRP